MSPSSDGPGPISGSGSSSTELVVTLPADLHARPAGRLARAAAGFHSAVTISVGDRSADARSVLMVMALGATRNSDVTIVAVGEDADAAVAALGQILADAIETEAATTP
jgi:phosphotransferase system HPr (HPr) family protein